ncbi:MAG TPA: ABC transporter permease, partial [Verrucomicrobiae bacterium]|nr:ABC transporter permease [Verrucomicrobiae bacterium]
MSALPRNAVSRTAPPPRSAWAELREAPGPFVRSRPHIFLIPLVFVVFVAAWEWAVRFWSIPNFLVPAPSTVAGALTRGLRSGLYLGHLWVTLYEALLGFFIAAAAGIILGAVIAQFRVMEQTFYPYLVALQTLPKIAIAPLIIVWFGFGISS